MTRNEKLYTLWIVLGFVLIVAAVIIGIGTNLLNISKECIDSIMFGDNSSVGYPKNISEYCLQK